MRAFRISLVLFALMIVLIGVSTAYGRRVCDRLQDMLASISAEQGEQAVEQAKELRNYWQKQTPYLRPIVNRTVVRTMSDLISDLAVYAGEVENAADFFATRQKVAGAIDEMRRSEKATFGLWS